MVDLRGLQHLSREKVLTRVMVAHGADDRFVSEEQIAQFKADMEAAKIEYTFKTYANAMHSFTNPGADKFGKRFNLPLKYNSQADKASWKDMQEFLTASFK